jgi:osmotically-inducible protein OsmY
MMLDVMKSDTEIKTDVLAELAFEPSVSLQDIAVLVKDGTVTLMGHTNTYSEKWHAMQAVKRLSGVKAIADEIKVNLANSPLRTDAQIAGAVASQLDWCANLPNVKVTVHEGWVTLDGQVEWFYQADQAEQLVRYLTGVKGVTTSLTVMPRLSASGVEKAIEAAFSRSAMLDAKGVHVSASGNNLKLTGNVRTYAELEEAGRMAWAAAGVASVDNQIRVK